MNGLSPEPRRVPLYARVEELATEEREATGSREGVSKYSSCSGEADLQGLEEKFYVKPAKPALHTNR